MRSEIILQNFYNKKKRRTQLEYEIERLEKSNKHLIEYKKAYDLLENIERRIYINNKLIAEKYIEIDNIIKEISEIEYAIDNLTDEERNISKLRFAKKKEYQVISSELSMSKSTVFRRVRKIIDKINEIGKKVS